MSRQNGYNVGWTLQPLLIAVEPGPRPKTKSVKQWIWCWGGWHVWSREPRNGRIPICCGEHSLRNPRKRKWGMPPEGTRIQCWCFAGGHWWLREQRAGRCPRSCPGCVDLAKDAGRRGREGGGTQGWYLDGRRIQPFRQRQAIRRTQASRAKEVDREMPFPEHGVRRCSKCGEWKPYDLLFPKGMGFGVRVRVLARGRKVRRPRPWCRECEYGAKMERVGGKRGEGVGIG